MKKQVGILSGVSLLALYGIQAQTSVEPASAVLLGSVLLAAAITIRRKARKA
jgi:hypothetical protein